MRLYHDLLRARVAWKVHDVTSTAGQEVSLVDGHLCLACPRPHLVFDTQGIETSNLTVSPNLRLCVHFSSYEV